jgi:hypothetical protein
MHKGLSPESEDPPSKEASTESTEYNVGGVPAELSNERYHELADEYLNGLIEKLEQLQEETEDVDCDYSVCPPSYCPLKRNTLAHLHLSRCELKGFTDL